MVRRAALHPWRSRAGLFPREAHGGPTAAARLDVDAGLWPGQRRGDKDVVLRSDEKTRLQARLRCHPRVAPPPGEPWRIAPADQRGGAGQSWAAWDVVRGLVCGRCEANTGLASCGRLVAQVRPHAPYGHADRVFGVVEKGAAHRGQRAIKRREAPYPNAMLVQTPGQASWLHPLAISWSMMQRKVLTPHDCESLAAVADRLQRCAPLHQAHPKPFQWQCDRPPRGDDRTRRNQRRVERGEEPWDRAEQPTDMAERPLDIAA